MLTVERQTNWTQRPAKRPVLLLLNTKNKKEPIMMDKKTIDELMYRIARYRSMGNGSMCQMLNSQLRALRSQVG